MSVDVFHALAAQSTESRGALKGDYLFHRGDPVQRLFLLQDASALLVRDGHDGELLILHRATGPAVFAEASLYSQTYHCDGICTAPGHVISLPVAKARGVLESTPELAHAWQHFLASELQAARTRSELLTRKTVAARLRGWIDWHGHLPGKGNWKTLAGELGVSPEALYREIGRGKSRR